MQRQGKGIITLFYQPQYLESMSLPSGHIVHASYFQEQTERLNQARQLCFWTCLSVLSNDKRCLEDFLISLFFKNALAHVRRVSTHMMKTAAVRGNAISKQRKQRKNGRVFFFLCGLYGKTATVYPEKVTQTKLRVLLLIRDTYGLPLALPPTLSPTSKSLQ